MEIEGGVKKRNKKVKRMYGVKVEKSGDKEYSGKVDIESQ